MIERLKEGIAWQMAFHPPGLKHLGLILVCCIPIVIGALDVGWLCDKPPRGILPKLLYRRYGRNGTRAWWIFTGLFCLLACFFLWALGALSSL